MATKNDTIEIRWFAARWPGKCTCCGEPFDMNADIGYVPSPDATVANATVPERLAGRDCCGGTGKILDSEDESPYSTVDLSLLMPHGKTAKDACKNCFIIHSAGQRECE